MTLHSRFHLQSDNLYKGVSLVSYLTLHFAIQSCFSDNSGRNCLSGEVDNVLCIRPGSWSVHDALTVGCVLALWSLVRSVEFVADTVDRRFRSPECIFDQYVDIFTTQRPLSGCIWWLWSSARYAMKVFLSSRKLIMLALKSEIKQNCTILIAP